MLRNIVTVPGNPSSRFNLYFIAAFLKVLINVVSCILMFFSILMVPVRCPCESHSHSLIQRWVPDNFGKRLLCSVSAYSSALKSDILSCIDYLLIFNVYQLHCIRQPAEKIRVFLLFCFHGCVGAKSSS